MKNHKQREREEERERHAEGGGDMLCNSAALVVQFFPVNLALVLVEQWSS